MAESDSAPHATVRSTRWTFDSHDADAARAARHSFLEYAGSYGKGSPFDTTAAELVLGELIGNVERHAPGSCVVDVEWNSDELVISVKDDGPCFALHAEAPDDLLAETGRGLYLVRQFTRRLEIEPARGGGCVVRAAIAL